MDRCEQVSANNIQMDKEFIVVFDADEHPLIADGCVKLDNSIMDFIAMVLSNLRNQEIQVLLVTAGAIIAGAEQLGLDYPTHLTEKQALAAIGQVELIRRYQNIFDEYNHTIGQVLLARNITEIQKHRKNAKNTFSELFNLGVIPIINENDTVSTDDIVQETNYPLTATVANIVEADIIVRVRKDRVFELINSSGILCTLTKEEIFSNIKTFKREGEFAPFPMSL